jgi:hypothetical protein
MTTMIEKERPIIKNTMEENDVLTFTLANTNVCFSNALRRTILSDIDVCCILSEFHETNQINIEINTGRLHNEILKHRLSCIPVHVDTDMEKFCEENMLEINCENNESVLRYVTTENFKVKNKITGEYVEGRNIFPPNKYTKDYIDFSRLRPKISDTIPGESLKLTAEFSIGNAALNSMYNVVSKCAYSNTVDMKKVDEKWKLLYVDFKAKELSEDAINFEKKNYYLLDAQRSYIPDSFDFIIQGIDIFDNRQICQFACLKLIKKFQYVIDL